MYVSATHLQHPALAHQHTPRFAVVETKSGRRFSNQFMVITPGGGLQGWGASHLHCVFLYCLNRELKDETELAGKGAWGELQTGGTAERSAVQLMLGELEGSGCSWPVKAN